MIEKESLSKPIFFLDVTTEAIIRPLYTNITSFVLQKIKDQLVKGCNMRNDGTLEEIYACYSKVWRLPCRNETLQFIDMHGQLSVDLIHRRWKVSTILTDQGSFMIKKKNKSFIYHSSVNFFIEYTKNIFIYYKTYFNHFHNKPNYSKSYSTESYLPRCHKL